jgi:hypothetical protein
MFIVHGYLSIVLFFSLQFISVEIFIVYFFYDKQWHTICLKIISQYIPDLEIRKINMVLEQVEICRCTVSIFLMQIKFIVAHEICHYTFFSSSLRNLLEETEINFSIYHLVLA